MRSLSALCSPSDDPAISVIGSRGLRIAFFTDTFAPTHDGVARVTDTLAGILGRQGHAVTVFTVRGPAAPRTELRPDGVVIRRYRSLPAPRYPQYRVALVPWSIPFGRRREFDLVHLHTPGFLGVAGWLAARRWGVPTVATYHTNLTDMLRGAGATPLSRAFFRAWSRFSVDLCRRADLATAPTEVARRSLLPDSGGRSVREPRVIPNGVDTERFRPSIGWPDWRARLGAKDAALVTFIGRLTRDKGIQRFLDAVTRIVSTEPWLAVVGGVGPEGLRVAERVRDDPALSRRVRIAGPVLEAEKPALLSQSSVFVLPSLSDTSSVALLEAMASGAPSVVTARGGPGELARSSGASIVVDPERSDELAGAVERLLADASLARQRSVRGRSWVVAHASAERMATGFVGCYTEVLGRRGSGGSRGRRIARG